MLGAPVCSIQHKYIYHITVTYTPRLETPIFSESYNLIIADDRFDFVAIIDQAWDIIPDRELVASLSIWVEPNTETKEETND